MQHMLWEVIAYIIFLYLIMMIAYSNRDPMFHRLHRHYSNMFVKGSIDESKPWGFWDLHKVSSLSHIFSPGVRIRVNLVEDRKS